MEPSHRQGQLVRGIRAMALGSAFVAATACTRVQSVDPALAAYIATIKAVDSHAHPLRPVVAGAPADSEYDALPLDGIPPFALPLRLRPDHPQWSAAARALYGVRAADSGSAFRGAVTRARTRVMRDRGLRFAEWALDQANIDIMLANRVALGPGLGPPRFRWVPFADALMLPLDTHGEAGATPDTRSLYPRETALLHRYLRDLKVGVLPPTFDEYVSTVVTPTLERQRSAGAVAIKFEAAYLRPLDFDDPDCGRAQRVYARYVRAGEPSHADYKAVQDCLFRVITRDAGRLGMAVQIHATEGFGGFYSATGSAPHLLEPALNDSTLRGTNFVIVHGGWPFTDETESLLSKPNVYTDLSAMTLFAEPSQIARVLREWLSVWQEKVLFGTDAFDGGPEQGWEQGAWVGSTNARRALGIALTGMMRDGEITRVRAETLARMVMRENAIAAYHLGAR